MEWLAKFCFAVTLATLLIATGSAFASVSSPAPDLFAPGVSALEVKANSEASNVSATQAEINLAIQHRGSKVNIVEQLKRKLGDDYAGVWFDNHTAEFVVPMATAAKGQSLTQRQEATVAQEFAAIALDGDFRTEVVEFSSAELKAAQNELNEKLGGYFEAHLAQTALDPSANAVIVRVPENIDSQSLDEIRRIASPSPVKTEVRHMPEEAFQAEPTICNEEQRKCDLPVRSGQVMYGPPFQRDGQTYNEVCTVGFRANGWDGRTYILTAGHCAFQEAKLGQPINWAWTTDTPTEGGGKPVGTLTQWHYDGRDWAKIDATGTWADTAPWPTMGAYWGATQEYPIWGEAKSYKGQTLCHIGMSTGASCGIVKEEDVDGINYGNGAVVGNMFEVGGSGLALGGGDSGGPVIANNIGYGIVSGGITAWHYATMYFSDIIAANAELNTNVAGPGAPEVITGSATTVEPYRAVVGGQYNAHQLQTYYWFEYGKSGYTNSTSEKDGGAGEGWSSTYGELTNLDPASTYKYRIRATNSLNTAYGSEGTFSTPAARPKVSLGSTTSIRVEGEDGKANLNGTVNPGGAPTSYRFEWGTTEAYGNKVEGNAGSGISFKAVEAGISSLVGNKTYYFRLFAQNEKGTAEAKGSFKTPDWSPEVVTKAASEVEWISAKANGSVDPRGFSTTYSFEYDTAEYKPGEGPHGIGLSEVIGGSGARDVIQRLGDLKPSTQYHFRLVARNREGVRYGEDQSFRTLPAVVLCKANEAPCKEANRYPAAAKTQAALKAGTSLSLSGSGMTITCQASSLSGEVTDPGGIGKAVRESIAAASFGGCANQQAQAVPISAEALNWQAEFDRPGGAGEGQLTITAMKLNVTLYSGVCIYQGSPTLTITGAAEAELTAAGAALTKLSGGFFCPNSFALTATYRLSAPAPLYVRAPVPGTVLCKANEAPCKEGNRYATATKTQAALKTGTSLSLSGGTTTITCQSSSLSGEVTDTRIYGKAARESIAAASFGGCANQQAQAVPISAEALSWQAEFDRPEAGGGRLTITAMKLNVTLYSGVCIYQGSPTLTITGAAEAELTAAGAALTKLSGGFLCPGSLALTATYRLSAPAPLYVSWPLPGTVLCKANEAPCKEGNRYATATKTQAGLKAGTSLSLSSSATTITCQTSSLSGEVTDPGGFGKAARESIAAASFGGCVNQKAEAAPVSAEGLSWQAEVDRPEAGGGRLTIAAMKLSVTFAGNPCVYQGSPTLMITGAAEAELAVTGATLPKQAGGFLCPNSFALTATYRLSAPAPLYVSWPPG